MGGFPKKSGGSPQNHKIITQNHHQIDQDSPPVLNPEDCLDVHLALHRGNLTAIHRTWRLDLLW